MTKAELVRQLEGQGCYVTERRVTDWVQKELLPPPKRGAGSGRAPVYLWDRPEDVIAQAEDVYHLLAWHGRASRLYLPLWLLGGEVPLSRVRFHLAERFRHDIQAEGDEEGNVEDTLSRIALCQFGNHRSRGNDAAPLLPEATELYLNVLFNPELDLSLWAESTDMWETLTRSSDPSGDKGVTEADTCHFVLQVAHFANEHLSVPHCRSLVDGASDHDLRTAQAVLRRARRLTLETLQCASNAQGPDFSEFVRKLAVHLGPWVLCLELSTAREGVAGLVSRILDKWEAMLLEFALAHAENMKVDNPPTLLSDRSPLTRTCNLFIP